MKVNRIINLLTITLLLTSLYACNEKSNENVNKKVDSPQTAINNSIKITNFPRSPLFDDAKLTNMVYKDGMFNFKVESESYQLGNKTSDADSKMCANSSKGQHIHLIVNDSPYAAKYTSEFKHDVEDGEHYLLAFLSRSYHESIKSPTARIAKKVTVENKSITAEADINESMIFYSRPKGTYVGKDTEKVMLDYYLLNPVQGQYVVAKINGEKKEMKKWRPYFLEGLPMGENTIELTLVNADGSKVDAPLNPVTRTFTLKADPEENM